jgi:hypothetical protein
MMVGGRTDMTNRKPEQSDVLSAALQTTADVILQVQGAPDDDDAEIAGLTQRLRAQLLDLNVESVDPVTDTTESVGAKGLEALIGWLAVRFGTEGLRTVVAAVVSWATRTGHSVEVVYGGDVLKVSGVTSAQQERLINDFLARHAARS